MKNNTNTTNLYKMFEHTNQWIFDLDNTVYSYSTNLFSSIDIRMKKYISKILKVDNNEAFNIQKLYFKKYGTTLYGLIKNHNINPHDFLDYVHNVDISSLTPNKQLKKILKKLKGKNYIFTNSSTNHATRILKKLEIFDEIEGIFDIVAANFIPKPNPKTYILMTNQFRIDASKAAMFDDIPLNLKPAKDIGMLTVLVRENKELFNSNYTNNDIKQKIFDIETKSLTDILTNIVNSY